ncbi:formiminoglutamate deiminase [Psychromicrobium silvestre]|uniref:Formiminoglutamate deiminase n=1 Tax=Psychromicrobium silvestre TaxID=1645614 RepID=A0A7Y9LSV2_9MICC|nr:formimidoylglutamate deiminase [Psychromicrobium silvestre]NYE94963.1 formiminoglutamate deiminase [Psychromicrobium silvestre]
MSAMFPAAVNAHSHAFHRVLRGRTHAKTGDFWSWRTQMYAAAQALTPELYEKLATAVYAEMVTAGYSAVGEFHYLHHRPDGSHYPHHEMEFALARAARNAGIRLTLLDTCYLDGGFGAGTGFGTGGRIPPNPTQLRFSDGDAQSWLSRLVGLRAAIAEEFDPDFVQVGAAVHSVRAVAPEQLRIIAAELDPALPLHVHLSEQPQENSDCLAATGLTPTGLLAQAGLLSARLSAVHATHLTEQDIALLGEAQATIVMCPTTEADLADGIGPALELGQAGAGLAIGSDQHAVVDPWQEMRALEYGERLRSGVRGRFSSAQLLEIAHDGGLRSLGRNASGDLVEIASDSVRTVGSRVEQLPMSATAEDVRSVQIGGREVARDGVHLKLGAPAGLLAAAIAELDQVSG